jgi:hypothetical protein
MNKGENIYSIFILVEHLMKLCGSDSEISFALAIKLSAITNFAVHL